MFLSLPQQGSKSFCAISRSLVRPEILRATTFPQHGSFVFLKYNLLLVNVGSEVVNYLLFKK